MASLAVYIYFSLAYYAIGRKAKITNPGIAWLPFGGSIAVIFESAKMHWWPFLVSSLGIAFGYILLLLSILLGSALRTFALAILILSLFIIVIMSLIWHWKTYENIH